MKTTITLIAAVLFSCNHETNPPGLVEKAEYLTNVTHDGHLFIQNTRSAVIHHPDCPCKKAKD